MPEVPENEHRYIIWNYNDILIPPGAVRVLITQDYLKSKDAEVGRRVRKRELRGVATYYYTEKRETDIPGKRLENESIITAEEYAQYLEEKDPALATIVKERATWPENGHYLELDNYREPAYLKWLHVLEIEVSDISIEPIIELSPETRLINVTKDPRCSNYQIAAGSLKGLSLEDFVS